MNILELLNENYILIPKIQRDYAHGRPDAEAKKIRKKLLYDIFEVLSNDNKSMRMNYIYGAPYIDEEDSVEYIILIDGQQRITTLFLLRLVLAVNAGEDCEFAKHFKYATRETSKQFCKMLYECTDCLKIFRDETVSERIERNKMFVKRWKKDPTVASMLTVLDAIREEILKAKDTVWFSNREEETPTMNEDFQKRILAAIPEAKRSSLPDSFLQMLLRIVLTANVEKESEKKAERILDFAKSLFKDSEEQAKEFGKMLLKHPECLKLGEDTVSARIKKHEDFKKEWEENQEVLRIFEALDALQDEILKTEREGYPAWYANLENVKFEYIKLEGFKQIDELYAAMNGRGKMLTRFELIKAELLGKCCDPSRDIIGIEGTINDKWIPCFWKLAKKLSQKDDDDSQNEFAAKHHDEYLFNYYYYVISMLWARRNSVKKNEEMPSAEEITQEMLNREDGIKEDIEFLMFSMERFDEEMNHQWKGFTGELACKKWNSDSEKVFLLNMDDLELPKLCCRGGDPFSWQAKCILWAYLMFKWMEKKEQTGSHTLRDYYILMRDIFSATYETQTPMGFENGVKEYQLWKIVQAFESIISGQAPTESKYQKQKTAFERGSTEWKRILNNPVTRGCSTNIWSLFDEDESSLKQFRENLTTLYLNLGETAYRQLRQLGKTLQRADGVERNYGEFVYKDKARVFLPWKSKMLESLFTMRCWTNEAWYDLFLKDLCKMQLEERDNTAFSPRDWQYYLLSEEYKTIFLDDKNQFAAFDMVIDAEGNEDVFQRTNVSGERATKLQSANPLLLAVYRGLNPGLDISDKKNHKLFLSFVQDCHFGLEKEDSGFVWRFKGDKIICDGKTNIVAFAVQEICKKLSSPEDKTVQVDSLN